MAQPVAFYKIEHKSNAMVLKVAMALGFAIATAIGAQIRIPLGFTPVPITLQTLFVFSSGLFLGGRFGLLSQVFYLFFGLVGLPVFSGSTSGVQVLFGATGGYLIGFLLFSYFSGRLFYSESKRTSFIVQAIQLYTLSLATIFLPGVVVLKIVTGRSWVDAVMLGFVPFIIGDIIKICAGLSVVRSVRRT